MAPATTSLAWNVARMTLGMCCVFCAFNTAQVRTCGVL